MRFPIFACFVVLIIWFTLQLRRTESRHARIEKSFWDREFEANSTRRKPLDQLDYIQIPLDSLPFFARQEDEKICEQQEHIKRLSEKKIVNFTGYSNTDLKLEYGAPNINRLSEYDQNYTALVRALYLWGSRLHELGDEENACLVLEFGISCQTDISAHYILLANIYAGRHELEKIDGLIKTAASLNAIIKTSLIRRLEEIIQAASHDYQELGL